MARYERLFTRYLLGHFDERDHHDGNDDPLLAEVAASAVVTAHNHVLRRWLRAGGQGDVEAQLDHAFAIVRDDLRHGHRRGPHRVHDGPVDGHRAAAAVRTEGEVLVAVARTDAPLDEVMRTIEQALKERRRSPHCRGHRGSSRCVPRPVAGSGLHASASGILLSAFGPFLRPSLIDHRSCVSRKDFT